MTKPSTTHLFEPAGAFTAEMKKGVYQAIHSRRDIRAQFLPHPVSEDVLARVLLAAHHAPSVGFSQPWNFLLIRDIDVRRSIHRAFLTAHEEAATLFPPEKSVTYRGFKLEGILEAPLNLCITYDQSRFGPVVVGRTATPAMGPFSSVCAVQNFWLAARAEGLGVGWVSIIHNRDLSRILELPNHVVPVAYLCVGYVSHFPTQPELETAGWLPRVPLSEIVATDRWGHPCDEGWPEIAEAIRKVHEERGDG